MTTTNEIAFPIAFSSEFFSCAVLQTGNASANIPRVAFKRGQLPTNSVLFLQEISSNMVPFSYIAVGK